MERAMLQRETPDATRIMVVEDERIVARDLCRTLEAFGYRVAGAARSAEEALAQAADMAPDLVLMDIRIKGQADGVEAATQLKLRYGVPVVFLTASSDEGTLQRAMRSQPDGYVSKPFTSTVLHTAIEVALQRHGAAVRLRETNVQLATQKTELEKRTRELGLLGEMGDVLQMCDNAEEALATAARFGLRLFPEDHGALYLVDGSGACLGAVASWGQPQESLPVFDLDACRALRRGQTHRSVSPRDELRCAHLAGKHDRSSICVPMMSNGTSQGILSITLSLPCDPPASAVTDKEQLATVLAQRISLTLTNLRIRDQLRRESILDPLTGLFNRRHMTSALDRELRLASRSGRSVGILIFDLDHFKKVNDQCGHAAADKLLCDVAGLLRSRLRAYDVPTRYGGDEIVVILPDTTVEGTRMTAEKLRRSVADVRVQHGGRALPAVSISVGVAAYPDHGSDAAGLLRAADVALYAAKAQGRNCVVVADNPAPLMDVVLSGSLDSSSPVV